MRRWSLIFLSAVFAGSLCAAEEPLPSNSDELLEIEPPLLIQSRSADGTFVLQGSGPLSDPEVEVATVEKQLMRATRNAKGGERLYRSGIISKVDAENRALKVIQLEAKLAEARLSLAKLKAHNVSEPSETANNSGVAQAAEAAQRTAEEKQRAELELALRNLHRQQKLLALGSGRKADVNRAEQRLAELQRPQN